MLFCEMGRFSTEPTAPKRVAEYETSTPITTAPKRVAVYETSTHPATTPKRVAVYETSTHLACRTFSETH